ncbi:M81 family metallopeptidase [Halomontanus rarus]|uniref:M81 family metallopeptidase n=1 Tax=Halomontanus rarus TaxID=3034020 RepID=UPI0023E77EF0|nr:M81 family metallopeptidase [Halovivax sp. TS33]
MHVAIGAMKHESNTFTRLSTGINAFDPVTGEDVFADDAWMDASATAGFVDAFEADDAKFVPTSFGRALPSGVVEADAYDRLSGGIVDGVRSADDLDAVYVDLHGSMFVEDEPDPEGDLLVRLREAVGAETPIVVSLDMHATLTDRMVTVADGFTAYRTAPHTDVYETGARAANLLRSILSEDRSTAVASVRVPMLLAGEQSETDTPPMSDLIRVLEETDQTPGVLSTSYLLGFPWADSPHNGVFALAVVDEASDVDAQKVAESLGVEIWDRRHEFDFTTAAYPLDEALDRALAAPSPTVVADSGDNPTAGATEDVTLAVERLLKRGVENALVAVIADPEAQRECADAGEGATVSLELGRVAPNGEEPLRLDARVETLDSVRGIDVAVVSVDGTTIVVTSGRIRVTDPTFLTDIDVDPVAFDIIVVKSGYLSPTYQAIAAEKMLALTPGDTNEILEDLPYKVVPRPTYPLDSDVRWPPTDE